MTKKTHSKNSTISDKDLVYMSSLSQAALEKPTFKSQLIVWVIFLSLIWGIIWADNAKLDKIVRGKGTVVPSTHVQLVQNLEGGIVENIFVHSGDQVKRGQILVKLDNAQYASNFGKSKNEQVALEAKASRLTAEVKKQPFKMPTKFKSDDIKAIYLREQNLYQNQTRQLNTSVAIIKQQIIQNKTELVDAYSQKKQLLNSYHLIQKQINMTQPLVRQGIASEVDLLKIKREQNDTLGKLNAVKNAIPKYKATIEESRQKVTKTIQKFRNDASEKLNEALTKIAQIKSAQTGIEDKNKRTNITSPVKGTISELLVATIGQVVKPGSDIVKIVPDDASLVLDTKVKPQNIGFIRPGLKAKIKFTAYDFSIYGGLIGTVENVSADTQVDKKGNSFYVVRIKTNKNHLGTNKKPLYLMAGMTAKVDIIVGHHTVLEYLMKPIIKTKDLAFRES